jgi:hypothetical protein
VLAADPSGLQLRLLQTVVEVAAEKNSTLVMPVPVELLRFFDRTATDGTATDRMAADPAPTDRAPTDQAPADVPGPPDPVQPFDTTASSQPDADGQPERMP